MSCDYRTTLHLLKFLSRNVRLATLPQLCRVFWPKASNSKSAERAIRTLVQVGIMKPQRLLAHPELELRGPVVEWEPGDPAPHFGKVSYRLRSRWTEARRTTTVYVASAKAAQLFAGHGGQLAHPLHATHDLHVSAIYLRLLLERPEDAARWVLETSYAGSRRGQKLPDAELQDIHGHSLKVIEFGGAYPPERVKRVHEECERRCVPYELW